MELSRISDVEMAFSHAFTGEVQFDDWSRGIYATDASMYQIMPTGVVFPRNDADVKEALRIAASFNLPVIGRGGGTSLAGQAVTSGLVIDFSRHMNQILEINPAEGWARVQPGVIRDVLNAELKPLGYHFAPDPATSSRCTIGGMVANNSSGTRSILYGKTVDHVIETRIVLADGCELLLEELSREAIQSRAEGLGREAHIYDHFSQVMAANHDEVLARFPKVMRRVGGYNLDEFTHQQPWNLAKLFCGSEGTLGLLLEAKIKLEPLPACTGLLVAQFATVLDGIRAAPAVVEHGPSAVEILDSRIINCSRTAIGFRGVDKFFVGQPESVLVVEFYGASPADVEAKLRRCAADLEARGMGYAWPLFMEPVDIEAVWNVRKNGLGLMLAVREDKTPQAFIEDACVPLEVLPEYIEKVYEICARHQVDMSLYAHASVGVIHCRPLLDMRDQHDVDRFKAISRECFDLVRSYHGSWSGEHGDGRVRSAYIPEFFGEQLYQAFRQVKHLFDPDFRLNPGDIIDAPPIDENLRFGPDYQVIDLPTYFQYREDRSFSEAVHMCTGVGACRKPFGGTMCPSYRATLDERHSTRGRANALRLAMSGQMGADGLLDPGLYEVMDLCLGCKGCKAECPSSVDLAKLKVEFLQLYHDDHGATLPDKLTANAARSAARIAGWKAPVVNRVQRSLLFRKGLEQIAGFDARRILPSYAREPFHRWFARHPPLVAPRKVVLFADTFTNYHEPELGIAATRLLESCYYEVVLAPVSCCQRTRISQGFLRDAKKAGLKTLHHLDALIAEGHTVVVLEPSCASALTDDLPDLIEDVALGDRIKAGVLPIDAFILREVMNGNIQERFVSPVKKILLHGHCHQKALYGTRPMMELLGMVDGLEVAEVDSGCCGMAGAFGYEKDHYAVSEKIGELALFPAIRKTDADTAILACGFSCRHQVEHFTGRKARHWVELIRTERQA
ncbi:MAG: FAD/FMN-containing dehydrogenase/Fe-S oxidoreductase [Candidatus Omnitrophota bacterium]|jgi:FAD/FMN-containing dehydrogenase/Fe-S oxidoreductase